MDFAGLDMWSYESLLVIKAIMNGYIPFPLSGGSAKIKREVN